MPQLGFPEDVKVLLMQNSPRISSMCNSPKDAVAEKRSRLSVVFRMTFLMVYSCKSRVLPKRSDGNCLEQEAHNLPLCTGVPENKPTLLPQTIQSIKSPRFHKKTRTEARRFLPCFNIYKLAIPQNCLVVNNLMYVVRNNMP